MNKETLSKKFFRVIPNSMSMVRCHVKKASEPEFSFAKFRVMANIKRGIDSVGEIAELHGVSQPAISKLVDSLVQESFIQRKKSSLDRRIQTLKLTPLGVKRLSSIKNSASKSFEPLLRTLNEKEKKELTNALDCLDKFFIKIQESKS